MKQNASKDCLTISRRVTRSATILHRNSLPLPDELVYEIFSRLPLKSIARCRCVCKLWSSILRSQDFTDSFLTRSRARPQLLFACEDFSREIHFFLSPQPENPEDNYSYVVATNHLARLPRSVELFGCTGGFLCYVAERILIGKKMKYYVPVICNPSTGQSLTLRNLKPGKWHGVESYLGYEPIAKEFKALSMESSYVSGVSGEHQVRTLGAKNSPWRLVECCVPHYPSHKWICISGVLYYTASVNRSSLNSMVACFDLRSEKFSFVKFMETFGGAMHLSTTLVNYDGNLGLIMSRSSRHISHASKNFELWVLRDAEKHEWSMHVFVLPPSWKDVITETMRIVGMVGTNEIVLSPSFQHVPSYIIYFNVESNRIRKVRIQGLEAFQGKRSYTYLNYVENVKIL